MSANVRSPDLKNDASAAAAEPAQRCLCGVREWSQAHEYTAPPPGETRFDLKGETYRRLLWRCDRCDHFISVAAFDIQELYRGEYVSMTYGDRGLRAAFERIISLPPETSDNVGRVKRIDAIARRRIITTAPSVLDIGSGLGVFVHAMRQAGWVCMALDPDPRAAAHAEAVVGVSAICDLFPSRHIRAQYDLVCFNKVLEHVNDPVEMLRACRQHLAVNGLVYIEVPDGPGAFAAGADREEFFIEHLHVFSPRSLAHLAVGAGFGIVEQGRLIEPSSKRTLWAMLEPAMEA